MPTHIYTRVSRVFQATEGWSLEGQRAELERYALYQKLTDLRYYEDAGLSGRRDDRPALLALLSSLSHGDTVLVHSLSRLGRGGAVQTLNVVRQLEAAGARLVSISEGLDSSLATGKLLLTILSAVAEMEVEQTMTRSKLGRVQAAREGYWPQGGATWGYRRGADRRLELDPASAEQARAVFLRAAGEGTEKLAQALEQAGTPAPWGGAMWSRSTLWRILKNPAYKGEARFVSSEGGHRLEVTVPCPALVTPDEWQAAQPTGRQNREYRDRARFPLTGALYCPHGAPLNGYDAVQKGGTRRVAYSVVGAQKARYRCDCKPSSIRAHLAHDEARALLLRVLLDPSDPLSLSALPPLEPPPDPHREERARLEGQLSNLVELRLEGLIDLALYRERHADLKRALSRLEPLRPDAAPLERSPALEDTARALERAEGADLAELVEVLEARFLLVEGALTLERYAPF